MFLALCLTTAGLIRQLIQQQTGQSQFNSDLRRLVPWALIGLGLGFIFIVLQAWLEYRRRTHDPTWILQFQKTFDNMTEERKIAALCLTQHKDHLNDLKKYEKELEDIDDVLDFFEDIGFYMRGDQISPEVAHHHLYHWIRGYWQASEKYVKAWQAKEPARWNHLEMLFETITEIEVSESSVVKARLVLEPDQLDKFLNDEIARVKPSESGV